MAGLLYHFVTDRPSAAPKEIAEWGRGYILDGKESLTSAACSGGTPSGKPGLLVANKSRLGDQRLDIDLEKQAWFRLPAPAGSPDSPETWVGWWKDSPPTSAELIRMDALPGFILPDAKGRLWKIPRVRSVDGGGDVVSALPRYYTLDPASGDMVLGDTMAQHAYLYEATKEPFDVISERHMYEESIREGDEEPDEEGGPREATDSDYLRWLAPVLSANYVVTAYELAVMGAFDSTRRCSPDMWVYLSTSVVDWVGWWSAKKKKLEPSPEEKLGSTSSPTEKDLPKNTAPHGQTS